MSRSTPPDFYYDHLQEVYRRWQKREETKDANEDAAHNRLVIENGDPECEKVIAALEQRWIEGR